MILGICACITVGKTGFHREVYMFDELKTCRLEELQEHAERIARTLHADNAEAFIRIL